MLGRERGVGIIIDKILGQQTPKPESAGRPAEQGGGELINPDKTIAFIVSTVTAMDHRLTVSRGMEVGYRGSGAEIPVDVLLSPGKGLKALTIATFRVTSTLSVSGEVGVGTPFYSREEIEASVTGGLERLTSKA